MSPLFFFDRRGGTDKQKHWYEIQIPETIVRRQPDSGSGVGGRSPRITDSMERYVPQLEKTEVILLGQTMTKMEIHMDGKKRKERDSCAYHGFKFAGGSRQAYALGGKSKGDGR